MLQSLLLNQNIFWNWFVPKKRPKLQIEEKMWKSLIWSWLLFQDGGYFLYQYFYWTISALFAKILVHLVLHIRGRGKLSAQSGCWCTIENETLTPKTSKKFCIFDSPLHTTYRRYIWIGFCKNSPGASSIDRDMHGEF